MRCPGTQNFYVVMLRGIYFQEMLYLELSNLRGNGIRDYYNK